MTRWLRMTAGLLIWAVHFLGLYLISSAADVWSSADAAGARLIGLAFSLSCLLALIGVAAWIWRRAEEDEPAAWERRVGLTGVMVAVIGVVWQSAPLAF